MIIFQKKKNMSKHDIILIIFKLCVSKIYLLVLLTNLKSMENHINQVDKYIRDIYWGFLLFL